MKITLIGNDNGIYINPTNNNAYIDYDLSENFEEVKNDGLDGVNHLVIRRENDGKMKIVQVNGWTATDGIFNRLY